MSNLLSATCISAYIKVDTCRYYMYEEVPFLVALINTMIGYLILFFSDVSWSSCDERERLSLDYPRICVHAVSRDVTSFPSPCVYLLYSASPPDSASSGSDDEGEVPDIDELPPTEVRLVPPSSDQRMYNNLVIALNITSCKMYKFNFPRLFVHLMLSGDYLQCYL